MQKPCEAEGVGTLSGPVRQKVLIMDMVAGVTAQINQEVVLYTDADVLFYHEFNPCKLDLPEVMAIAPEMDRVANSWSEINWNAGVLVMNLQGFAAVLPNMILWANQRHWDFDAADQSMLNEYFPAEHGRPLDQLPDAYNWKGYWGCSPDLVRLALPSACLSISPGCLSVCLPACLSLCLSGFLSVSLSTSLSVSLFVCLSVCAVSVPLYLYMPI